MGEAKHGVKPIVVEETPGKKAYCACGLSANLPYCDVSFRCSRSVSFEQLVGASHQTGYDAHWLD